MKKNRFPVILASIVFICICVKMVLFTGLFDPNDTTAEQFRKQQHKNVTIEGSFLDSKGNVIFSPSEVYSTDKTRVPVEFAYVIGYNDPKYQSSALRRQYSDHLYEDLGSGKGGSVQLTIDSILQKKAYTVLQERDLSGSVIILNAENAEILAMASRRETDFNITGGITPKDWEKYNEIEGFFLPPATGDYKAPGSVFKALTSAAAYINGMEDYTYVDNGLLLVDGKKINNSGNSAYGFQNLKQAFINSTNTYFGSLSLELGEYAMKDVYRRFLVGDKIDLGFTMLNSTANFNGSEHNLALMGFGQGGVALSPLHMAMIGQSIVNGGNMVKPSLVKALYDAKGNRIFLNSAHDLIAQPIKGEVADNVKELMRGVTLHLDDLKRQRGESAWTDIYTPNIYLKTGTAQVADYSNVYHSYILCMTEEYVILVSVNDTHLQGSDLKYVIERFLKELY